MSAPGPPVDAGLPRRPEPHSQERDRLFIGGTWRVPEGAGRIAVHDCATEEVIGHVPSGGLTDVDAAVAAARAALPGWSATSPATRADQLERLSAALKRRVRDLSALISAEVGTAARLCAAIQVESAVGLLDTTVSMLREHSFEERAGNSIVVQQPVGVAAAITPWNYPLFQAMAKVAGALAAGCTVVHKPSGLAPFSAFLLAEAVEQADLPGGVYNLVSGPGTTVGEALARHAGIDMVTFTGSTAAGTRVYELATSSIKRVALELGGKSASVLLADALVDVAVKSSVNRAFLNSGQTCDAWTRLIVPLHLLDEVLEQAKAATARLTVGDPFDERTRLGPLVSAEQEERVRAYVHRALRDGAKAALGGPDRPASFERGHYVQPTILVNVTPSMTIANEEVFGPVLCVMTYDDSAEALAIANGTEYGLSGAVWSADADRAQAFARRMRAGQVVINGGRFNPLAPAGGMKRSGLGREFGRWGMEEFLEPQALQL